MANNKLVSFLLAVAIALGTIKHPELAITENPWYTSVPTVLPNTKVRLRAAIMAAAFAGTGFYLFQTLFIFLMKWMTSYSAIYGSFAALPLFLLWMQYSAISNAHSWLSWVALKCLLR